MKGAPATLVELLPALRGFCHGLTGGQDEADDLLHSTVRRLLHSPAPADADLSGWAVREARNLWLDSLRADRGSAPHSSGFDDEEIAAWLDGELGGSRSEALVAAMDTESELQARVEQLRGDDERLAQLVDSSLPMPAAIVELARQYDTRPDRPAEIVSLAEARARRAAEPGTSRSWGVPLAAAALLLVAVAFLMRPSTPNFGPELLQWAETGLHIDSRHPWFAALDTMPAGRSVALAEQSVELQQTFASRDRGVCRQFELRSNSEYQSVVACRDGAGWVVHAANEPATGTVSEALGALDGFVDANRVGEVLDIDEERVLMRSGWRLQ